MTWRNPLCLPSLTFNGGYNNICIQEEDQWNSATFITPMGLFELTVMFFGFCNAPPTFQVFINHIFADMLREKWLKIYMDDLGGWSTWEMMLPSTMDILDEYSNASENMDFQSNSLNVYLMPLVWSFWAWSSDMWERSKMDEKKLEAIEKWKPPTSVKGVWPFTGFANFYRKFIPDFSNIVTPLNLLTQKEEPWNWMSLQQKAFE